VRFLIFTKRVLRIGECLPDDWGEGWDHVTIVATCENDERARQRLPVFLSLPIAHRRVACEPMLGKMDLSEWLSGIEEVMAGGESGSGARVCDYDWILDVRRQCAGAGCAFTFHQTGERFLKDGRLYNIPRRLQELQAARANIDLARRV
jgi:protein gp37